MGVTRHSFPGERHGNLLQYSCLENPMKPGRLQSMGSQESDMTERLSTHRHNLSLGVLQSYFRGIRKILQPSYPTGSQAVIFSQETTGGFLKKSGDLPGGLVAKTR